MEHIRRDIIHQQSHTRHKSFIFVRQACNQPSLYPFSPYRPIVLDKTSASLPHHNFSRTTTSFLFGRNFKGMDWGVCVSYFYIRNHLISHSHRAIPAGRPGSSHTHTPNKQLTRRRDAFASFKMVIRSLCGFMLDLCSSCVCRCSVFSRRSIYVYVECIYLHIHSIHSFQRRGKRFMWSNRDFLYQTTNG